MGFADPVSEVSAEDFVVCASTLALVPIAAVAAASSTNVRLESVVIAFSSMALADAYTR